MTPVTLAAELIRHSAEPEKRTGCHPSQHRAATHLYGRFSHADIAGRAVWSAAMSTIDVGGSERLPLARQARCNTRPAEPHLAGRAVDVICLDVLVDEAPSADLTEGRHDAAGEP
jgi:hypothetical protein